MEKLRVEVLSHEAAAAHAGEWHYLAAHCLEPNGFLEPGFALAAARHLAGPAPQFLLVWEGRKLRGLCPLHLPGRFAFWSQVRVWTHVQAPLGVPLLDAERAGEVLVAILAYCRERLPHDAGLMFPLLPQNGPTARLLSAAAPQGIHLFAAYQRAILRAGPDSDWTQAVSSSRRRKLQKARKGLEARGALTFRLLRDPDELRIAAEQFLVLEAKGWKGRHGTALLNSAPREAFARRMMSSLSNEGKLSIGRFDCAGVPIAMAILLEVGSQALYWKVTYDEDFAGFSPGVLMSVELTRALLSDARIAFTDSCADPGQMIEHLWRERMALADFFVPLGAGRKRFAAAVARETVRRNLRRRLKEIVRHLRRLKDLASRRSAPKP
jgi:CelD/BcsL family acetyltransferase involved in cellulose biosynthesis